MKYSGKYITICFLNEGGRRGIIVYFGKDLLFSLPKIMIDASRHRVANFAILKENEVYKDEIYGHLRSRVWMLATRFGFLRIAVQTP